MKRLKLSTNECGYALIEVVFLIAVIAILSSIVIPKIGNGMKIAQADYLMKSLYCELRFTQAATRITAYKKEEILHVNRPMSSFVVIGNNAKKQYRIRLDDIDNTEFRKYKLPPSLSFKNDFYLLTTLNGNLYETFSKKNSGTIKILNSEGKEYKPFIVFDSVGRIRFSNSSS